MTLNMTDQVTALEIVRRAQMPEPFKIIDLMQLTNEMLIDVPAYECNSGTIHKTLQRTIKPMGEHRIYNQGVGNVATQTFPIEDRTTILDAYSKVDAKLIEHSGNPKALKLSESVGIIKGMGLTQAWALIYADKSKSEEFDGLYTRRKKLDKKLVIDAGGKAADGELTSIYLTAVGPDLFHLLYPQGSKSVGIERSDLGLCHVPDENNPKKTLPVYQEYFSAQYGLCVRQPEAVIRICNIPIKTIKPDELVELIIETRRKMPQGASTYAMYSNQDVLIKLDKAAYNKVNVVHSTADPWGKVITHVRDLRCRQMDVILNTEEAVA